MPLDGRQVDDAAPAWNMDSWAGYPAARDRLLKHIEDRKLTNVVATPGDGHQNYAGELSAHGAEGPTLATEFLGASISSAGDAERRPDGKLSTRARFAVERGKPGLRTA